MTALLMERPVRRGACPGLSAPMPTGDGLLVRLLPTGTIPLAAFVQLCAAARQFGNGVVEITSRGSIQVRGLSEDSVPRFAEAVAALGIAADESIPVLAGALAGLDAAEIIDASVLAVKMRAALSKTTLAARLAPKVSIVIDGGGTIGLDEISADVRLSAEKTYADVTLRVAVGGDEKTAIPLGAVAAARAVEAVTGLLEVVAQRGRTARARDVLAREGAAPFRAAVAELLLPNTPRPPTSQHADAIGKHMLRDASFACGIGLAFGHADAANLERLAEAAGKTGAAGFRAGAPRALLTIGLDRTAAAAFVAAAANLGFIVEPSDPRRHVIACAGAPICSSAHLASRSLAPLVAGTVGSVAGGPPQVHISGCAKSCAHAGSAALTVVGSPAGCALIANGTARDAPFAIIAASELPAAIEQYFREPKRETGHI